MKKNIVFFSVIIFIIFLSVSTKLYFTPVTLNNIVSKQIDMMTVKTADITIYMSPHLSKDYEINEKAAIDSLSSVFNKVKVRHTLFPPETFNPLLYETYYLTLYNDKKAVPVYFDDKNYIEVNHCIYKIVNKPDLKQINDIATSVK